MARSSLAGYSNQEAEEMFQVVDADHGGELEHTALQHN